MTSLEFGGTVQAVHGIVASVPRAELDILRMVADNRRRYRVGQA
jgi:hypothetical protein